MLRFDSPQRVVSHTAAAMLEPMRETDWWRSLKEHQQRQINERVMDSAQQIAFGVHNAMASNGMPGLAVKLKGVQMEKGKLTLELVDDTDVPWTRLHQLLDGQIVLVLSSPDGYDEEREELAVSVDEPEMTFGAGELEEVEADPAPGTDAEPAVENEAATAVAEEPTDPASDGEPKPWQNFEQRWHDLHERAESAAKNGTAAYQEFYYSCSGAERQGLEFEHERRLELARAADLESSAPDEPEACPDLPEELDQRPKAKRGRGRPRGSKNKQPEAAEA